MPYMVCRNRVPFDETQSFHDAEFLAMDLSLLEPSPPTEPIVFTIHNSIGKVLGSFNSSSILVVARNREDGLPQLMDITSDVMSLNHEELLQEQAKHLSERLSDRMHVCSEAIQSAVTGHFGVDSTSEISETHFLTVQSRWWSEQAGRGNGATRTFHEVEE